MVPFDTCQPGILKPPLALSVWPVMPSDSGPAKNAAAFAMSWQCAGRSMRLRRFPIMPLPWSPCWLVQTQARFGVPGIAHRQRVAKVIASEAIWRIVKRVLKSIRWEA